MTTEVQLYRQTDQLFLWLLTDPLHPILIGDLNIVRSLRGVSLRYAGAWIERGFALSEDLPLIDQELMPVDKDTAAGAVDDVRSDLPVTGITTAPGTHRVQRSSEGSHPRPGDDLVTATLQETTP